MFGIAKVELRKIFKGVREENKNHGYIGPLCCLQLDLTAKSIVGYVVASVQIVRFFCVSEYLANVLPVFKHVMLLPVLVSLVLYV